ncbi:MAG TPA: N-6 DNA methylase [Solirubrobacteraceae bacterium]|nr:N-6 DNA methylase [Solirubrobacteraceae bacterium]
MANEELIQRGYLTSGVLKGDTFGAFEHLNLGGTTIKELRTSGLDSPPVGAVPFAFAAYKPPANPERAKPDGVYAQRVEGKLRPVAVGESKAPAKLKSDRDKQKAAEQAFFSAAVLGAPWGITSDGTRDRYIDVAASLKASVVVFGSETRDLNPAVLNDLLTGEAGMPKDPKPLAENVWQTIWHATKAEPKECLLTFVEIFVLKFLSDNLPKATLPDAYRFYALTEDPAAFHSRLGKTAIEYYVEDIRPQIKKLFPDNTIAHDPGLPQIFGLATVVSKTSVINGFAFLKTSSTSLANFDRTFRDILKAFEDFGPLTAIDPEFKLRLYETFLKRSARQQKLGQFFTPRNVVRPMIEMAQLGKLPDGALVLDPAAGVGGFVLEPLLFPDALPGNIRIESGVAKRRVRCVGLDVDADLHILAKANMLIHLAEAVRDPATTLPALNVAMADTFLQMNQNETLGSLEYPPQQQADIILTNPPYVTKGSAIYQKEIAEVPGLRNGVVLRDYYNGAGLGVESLFLRYIAGALKSGGRAFVIVPLGLLNRTEPGPKERLLSECNIRLLIELPSNTFFNTAQKTYILGLERRHTDVDPRPDVFCAKVRTIGETLDWKRIPEPSDNDLDDVAAAYVAWANQGNVPVETEPLIKIVDADNFTKDDRWDVARLWSDEELVSLGMQEPPIARLTFIDEVTTDLETLASELKKARDELDALTRRPMEKFSLGDLSLFQVRAGRRITGENIRLNPGEIDVISCFKAADITKGRVSESWLTGKQIPLETKPVVTVNANGASIGRVFVRRGTCALTDDVIAVSPVVDDIDLDFLAAQLRSSIAAGSFVYEAKLFVGRVRSLEVELPVLAKSDGGEPPRFDMEHQKRVASAVRRFDSIRARISDLGRRSGSARISDMDQSAPSLDGV